MNALRWRHLLTAAALLVGPLCTTGCRTETTSQPTTKIWTSDSTTSIPPTNGTPGHTLLPGGVPNGISSQ